MVEYTHHAVRPVQQYVSLGTLTTVPTHTIHLLGIASGYWNDFMHLLGRLNTRNILTITRNLKILTNRMLAAREMVMKCETTPPSSEVFLNHVYV